MSQVSREPKLKQSRNGHRVSAKRLMSSAEEAIELNIETDDTILKLTQLKKSISEKRLTLSQLDERILDTIDDEEMEEEISQCDRLQEAMLVSIVKLERCLDKSTLKVNRLNISSREPECEEKLPKQHLTAKLPKLELKKFYGDCSTWISFWDSFESAIHKNDNISDVDKFNYLKSLLGGVASDAVSGLPLSANNYNEAIVILQKRFGNKQVIINRHMEMMLNLPNISSTQNLRDIRLFCDKVENNIRCLNSLGVSPVSYGSILAPVIMEKLPNELKLIISREIRDKEWEIEHILQLLNIELEARERMGGAKTKNDSKPNVPDHKHSYVGRYVPTATALQTSANITNCTFCNQAHRTNSCHVVTSIEARRQALIRANRCFLCLRKGHMRNRCQSDRSCLRCNGRHHISICDISGQSNQQRASYSHPAKTNHDMRRDRPDERNQINFSSSEVTQQTSMYVHTSSLPVLLQTAKCRVINPSNRCSQTARIIFDTGSQRSYISEELRNRLGLVRTGEKTIIIKTFGSTEEKSQTVDTVSLNLQTKFGTFELSLFVVPLICEPLRNQPLKKAKTYFPRIASIEFADFVENEDDVKVDILIGSDQYYSFINGGLIKGKNGLTALNTKLGWVLSGPVGGSNGHELHQASYLTTHTLRCDVSSEDEISRNSELERNLTKFWDLETLGIRSRTAYEEMLERISFKNDKYEVSLPWKEHHPVLPDNYMLSKKQLNSLLTRLKSKPHVLKEYDSVIQEQLKSGVVEIVEEPHKCESHLGKVHYIPHHAVIRTDKNTTKLRIVYNASARYMGASLNDCLLAGPSLSHKILDILLRFRVHRIALTGDIERAFLMIGIAKEDRDVLRFLWVQDIDDENSPQVVLRFTI